MPPRVVGVVLAAGKSVRMGSRKASLAIDAGDTYLTRLLRTFSEAGGLSEIVAVLGHDASAVEAELSQSGLAVRRAINPGFEAGQLSSLIVGLDAAAAPNVGAILLGLVDAPLVSVRTVQAVIARYLETGAPVVRPVRGSQHGHPVLIDRALFDAIRRVDPAAGVKPVVREHVSHRGDVDVDDEGAFMDIDTPEAHERAMQWWSAHRVNRSPEALVAPDAG
jgi:molybdenum cofactor cytidylyltransferase